MAAARLRRDGDAVTPLVGTLLVLGITVVGMATVIFLGTPVIARLRDQGALHAAIADFDDVRHDVGTLSLADAVRTPGVSPHGGLLTLDAGTRFMVSATLEAARVPPVGAPCEFRVVGWSDGNESVSFTNNCRVPTSVSCGVAATTACFQAFRLPDLNTDRATAVTGVGATITGGIGDDEWRFLLTSDTTTPPVTTYAEAWILNTDRLHWTRSSPGGSVEAIYEGGAIFASERGSDSVARHPHLSESIPANTASTALFFHLPTLDGEGGAIGGDGEHNLILELTARPTPRIASDTAERVRFDFLGDSAEAWCNTLLLRNAVQPLPPGFSYQEDPNAPCATGNTGTDPGLRSVAYADLTSIPFPFQFTEDDIHAELQV